MIITSTIDRCLALWSHVALDTHLVSYVTTQDLSYVEERARREGIEFLTVDLPKLGKALESALETGQLERVDGFSVSKGSILPKLFHKTWLLLFTKSGELRWHPSPTYRAGTRNDFGAAVQAIRQLTLMFYKLEMPHHPEKTARVIDSFINNEWELLTHGFARREELLRSEVFDLAKFVVRMVLGPFHRERLVPRHGSGASACSTKPWDRYSRPRYSKKLAECFPYDMWFTSGLNGLEAADWLREEPISEHMPARVVLVPKDSRGPRLISCEPREHMFIQQGIMSMMYERFLHYANVKQALDCTDQSRNRELCLLASEWLSHASLDLKDASDRVPYWLIEALFPRDWFEVLDCCRSESTILPNGKEVYLSKFAPMGSACCFPVEALVFFALVLAVTTPSKREIFDLYFRRNAEPIPALERVSVFGDDIIVPTKYSERVINTLEDFGLLVNRQKSFSKGPFRESCGLDACDGICVSIVRVRHLPLGQDASKHDYNHAMFRTRDFINNVALHYGIGWCSTAGADVFRRLYGPVTVKPMSNEGIASVGSFLIILGPTRSVPPLPPTRVRRGNSRVRILRESGVDIEIDTGDWSHLLRVTLTGSRDRQILETGQIDRAHAGMVSPARRVRYTQSWVDI